MNEKTEETLKQMFVDQWKLGLVAGVDLILMAMEKIKLEAPGTKLSVDQIIDIVNNCKVTLDKRKGS